MTLNLIADPVNRYIGLTTKNVACLPCLDWLGSNEGDDEGMATISQIAQHAGVSVATVSRAFSHPHLIRPQTLDKVHRAIEELGYRPNAIARHLRRKRTETVIVIVPQIQNTFFSGIIQGIENLAHDRGFRILLGETRDDQARLDHYADMVSMRVADGLILLGSLLPTAVASAISNDQPSPLPLVLACERFEGLECPHVAIDNAAAARAAVAHLAEQGCRRIAIISGPPDNTLSKDRHLGYCDALHAAGLNRDPTLELYGDFTVSTGFAAARDLLALPDRPDALFCANDEMAIGARQAIREAGLRVPQDIALVGFDDIRFAEYLDPPLTTIRQPTAMIGEQAMALMIDLLEDPAMVPQDITLPAQLVVRGSSLLAQADCATG